MRFLCGKHRHALIQLPESEISAYWTDWMSQAGQHYSIEDWGKAKLFAGSAMDLACSALLRKDINHANMAVQSTLSTIYTINCFQQLLEIEYASQALDVLTQRIIFVMNHTDDKGWGATCLAAFENQITQASFFQSYMTLPLVAAKSANATQIHYSNNVVNLH